MNFDPNRFVAEVDAANRAITSHPRFHKRPVQLRVSTVTMERALSPYLPPGRELGVMLTFMGMAVLTDESMGLGEWSIGTSACQDG